MGGPGFRKKEKHIIGGGGIKEKLAQLGIAQTQPNGERRYAGVLFVRAAILIRVKMTGYCFQVEQGVFILFSCSVSDA